MPRIRDHRPASIAHRIAQGSTQRPTCATSAQPICTRRWPSIGHDARRVRMQLLRSRAASARPRAVHRAASARWCRARSATICVGRACEARASVREEGAAASGGGRPRSKTFFLFLFRFENRFDTIRQFRIDQIRKTLALIPLLGIRITPPGEAAEEQKINSWETINTKQLYCGRYRQSGQRPDTRLLRHLALEGMTRSARTDSPRRIGRNKFRRRGGGGGL
ncbi:oxidoreductase family protein [Dorcoceras hygrometricum]|uniref:Oxidoreductase family protein n=1 Tax=Dorcoceras hygrometricum TaxID=472368 RepID=A0A2Z7CFA5_9LAMI|nr:oxidoreductase family protein [Dorcoceras hygrometricum]